MKKKRRFKLNFSPAFGIFLLSLVLSLIGLFFVFEASTIESFNLFNHPYHFFNQQAMWLGLGLVVLLITTFIPLKFWQHLAPIIYIASLIAMLLVFIPGVGLKLNGARRWFLIAGFSFQPVEILKISTIIYFADWLSKHQRFLPFVVLSLFSALLLLLQPDMGSLLIILWISFGLYFLAGGEIKTFLLSGGAGVFLLAILILTSPYRLKRLQTFLDPDSDPLGASFHIKQVTLALGSGAWFGRGIGNSVQKYAYIPEASSDSIFAIVAEELGFFGSSLIILLFFTLFYLAYKVAHKYPDQSFPFLMAMGINLWLTGQILLNLSALVALVPLTGLPLPFFSYGGSALLMVLFGIGLLLRLANKKEIESFSSKRA